MKYITKEFGDLPYIYLIPIGDTHISDVHFHEKKFLELRDWMIKQPNAYGVLLGDIINAATKNSKSDIYTECMNPTQAMNYALELLTPIKERLLASTIGNHEERIWRESGIDVAEIMARELGVPYDKDGVLLNIKFDPYPELRKGKVNYTLYMNHGHGGGGTKGAKINAVSKLANIVLVDAYLAGHVHFATTFKDAIYVPDTRTGKVVKMTRTYISSGSFLDYGGYAEKMGMSPAKLGVPRCRLDGRKKDLHVSI